MTAEQMKYEFDVGYDKITNFDAPGYVPKEISTFLTRAQESIVYEILESSAYDEKNKKSISMLRQVLPMVNFTTGNYPNGYLAYLQALVEEDTVSGDVFAFVSDGITDVGNRFVTAGFRTGDVVVVLGSTTTANNKEYSVIGVTANKLTVSPQTLPDTVEAGSGTGSLRKLKDDP